MSTQLQRYIEIKNLSNPQNVFEILKNKFIDIMYPDHFYKNNLIMLLDEGIDANKEEDILWLKQLLDTALPEIGEIDYILTPYTPEN